MALTAPYLGQRLPCLEGPVCQHQVGSASWAGTVSASMCLAFSLPSQVGSASLPGGLAADKALPCTRGAGYNVGSNDDARHGKKVGRGYAGVVWASRMGAASAAGHGVRQRQKGVKHVLRRNKSEEEAEGQQEGGPEKEKDCEDGQAGEFLMGEGERLSPPESVLGGGVEQQLPAAPRALNASSPSQAGQMAEGDSSAGLRNLADSGFYGEDAVGLGGPPALRGRRGMAAVVVRSAHGVWLSRLHNAYVGLLQLPGPLFAAAAFTAPLALSAAFTAAYLLDADGLTLNGSGLGTLLGASPGGLLFRMLMFSLALSTGLQPDVVPASPTALLLANLNALLAELLFVFLSGAVFARLSQPARPILAAKVAVVKPPTRNAQSLYPYRLLEVRFVLSGAPRCELIDCKVDLTLATNTLDATGHHFRQQQSLKLVRAEVAHLQLGFNARHVIDTDSPLAYTDQAHLADQDAAITLSVVGVERVSLQTVFHSQQYFFVDEEVIWGAEYEDILTVDGKGFRLCDHTKLDMYQLRE